jgi:Fe-S cluster biogenesis protein NfuA
MPSVKSVYLGTDFLTVTKDADQPWAILKPEIYAAVMDFLSSGQPLVTDEPMHDPNAVLESDSEVVAMIKELLTSRIRPAIQDDGGDVEFVSFEQGVVKLKMKGSCRGCSSSAVTLKSGIEKMMQVIHWL